MKFLQEITRVVSLLCILLVIGIAVVLMRPVNIEKNRSAPRLNPISASTKKALNVASHKASFDSYEKVFKQRDLFQSLTDIASHQAQEPGQNSKVNSGPTFFGGKYKVVAIVIDQNPETVIQDTNSKETYFLSVGQNLNGAVVKEIQPGKVVLDINGRSIELSP